MRSAMANRRARSEDCDIRPRGLCGTLSCSRMEAVITDAPLLSRYGSRHRTAQADALCNAAVFGIVEAGVGDLQAFNGSLDRRNFCCETRLTDGLAMLETSDFGGNDVVFGQLRVEELEASEGLRKTAGIVPAEFFVGDGHVVRNVDDVVGHALAKVGKLDHSGDG